MVDKILQDIKDQAEADRLLEKIEQEVKSADVGHKAYNRVKYAKNFNTSLLENSVFSHDDELLDDSMESVDDSHSTFDEANYKIGFEEYCEDN